MTFRRAAALLVGLAALGACGEDALPALLPTGTWGGEGAGLIVSEQAVHVHLGCTRGDIEGRVPIAADGSFDAAGRHNVDAFPVDLEIYHPARFRGRLHGPDRLTIEVTLTDTGQRLGPAQAFLGREPRLGPCPICEIRPTPLGLMRRPRPWLAATPMPDGWPPIADR